MPIAELCPKCGKGVKAPDHLAGKRVKCLQCQTSFTLSTATPVCDEAAAPPEERPEAEQSAQREAVPAVVRAAFWLGLASVLLGVAAMLCGLFPSTLGYARSLCWLGILLGGGTVVLAIIREECSFGAPFTGSVVSLLSLALVALWLGAPVAPGEGRGGPPGGPPGQRGQGPPPDWKGGPAPPAPRK
jgi:hypothetical protein